MWRIAMNIGLVGGLGSGKTTIANYLTNNDGYKKYSLADPMREIIQKYFGVNDKHDPRYRSLMQKLGTDWFRNEEPLVWVNYLKNRIEQDNEPLNVVDDVRFVNEAIALLSWGWQLIYIDCPVDIRRSRCIQRDGCFDEKSLEHQSEKQVEQIFKELSSKLIVIDGAICINDIPRQIENILKLVNGHSNGQS
jgi:dephospho-CoA kinase